MDEEHKGSPCNSPTAATAPKSTPKQSSSAPAEIPAQAADEADAAETKSVATEAPPSTVAFNVEEAPPEPAPTEVVTPLDLAKKQLETLIEVIVIKLEGDSRKTPASDAAEAMMKECAGSGKEELVLALRECICQLSLRCSIDEFCEMLMEMTGKDSDQHDVLVLQALNRFLQFHEAFGMGSGVDEDKGVAHVERIAVFGYGKADAVVPAMHEICIKVLGQLSHMCLPKLTELLCSELKSTGYWNRGEGVLRKLQAVQSWAFCRSQPEPLLLFLEHVCATLKRAVSRDLVEETAVCCENVLKSVAKREPNTSGESDGAKLKAVLDTLAVQAHRNYQKRKQPMYLNLLLAVVCIDGHVALDSEHAETLARLIKERVDSDDTRLSGLDHLRRLLEATPRSLDSSKRQKFATLVKQFLNLLLASKAGEVPMAQEASVLSAVIAEIGLRDPESALVDVIEKALNHPISLNKFSSAQRSIALRSLGMIARDISETFPIRPYERYVEVYVGRSIPSAEVKEAMTCFPYLCADSSKTLDRIVSSAFGFEPMLVEEARQALKRMMSASSTLHRDRAIEACIASRPLQLSSVSSPTPEIPYLIACMDTVNYIFEGYEWTCALRIELAACCMLKLMHPSKRVRVKCRKVLETLGFNSSDFDPELLDACHQKLLNALSWGPSRCGVKGVVRERGLLEKNGALSDENDPLHWWVIQAHAICSHNQRSPKKESFIKSLLRVALFGDPFTASAASKALGGLTDSFEIVQDSLPIITPNDFAVNRTSAFYNENIIDLLATLPPSASRGITDYQLSFAKEWVNAVTSNSVAATHVMEQWGKSSFRSAAIVLGSLGQACTKDEEIDYRSTAVSLLCSIWFKRSRSREICRALVKILEAGSVITEETAQGYPNPVSSAIFTLWYFHERETDLVRAGLVALLRHNKQLTNLYLHYAFGICQIEQESLSDQSIKPMFAPTAEFDFRDYTEEDPWDSAASSFANSITFALFECSKARAPNMLRPDLFCLLVYQLSHPDGDVREHAAKMALNASSAFSAENQQGDASAGASTETETIRHVLEVKRNGIHAALCFARQIAETGIELDRAQVLKVAAGVLSHTSTAVANRLLSALKPIINPPRSRAFDKDVYNALLKISKAHAHEASYSWEPWSVLAHKAQDELVRCVLDDLCKSDLAHESTKHLYKRIFREIAEVDQLRERPRLVCILSRALRTSGEADGSCATISFVAPWSLAQICGGFYLRRPEAELHQAYARLTFEALLLRGKGPEAVAKLLLEELHTTQAVMHQDPSPPREDGKISAALVQAIFSVSTIAGHELLRLAIDYLVHSTDNSTRAFILVVLENAKIALSEDLYTPPFHAFAALAARQMQENKLVNLATTIDALKYVVDLVARCKSQISDGDACACVDVAVCLLQTAVSPKTETIPVLRSAVAMLDALLRQRRESVDDVVARLEEGLPQEGFLCALCNLELYFSMMPLVETIRRDHPQYARLIILVSYLISLSNHAWVESNLSRFITSLERWSLEEESREDALIRMVLARLIDRLKGRGESGVDEQSGTRESSLATFLQEYRDVSTMPDVDKEVVDAITTLVRVNGPILFAPIYDMFCELATGQAAILETAESIESCRLLLHYAIKYKLGGKYCLKALADVCRRGTSVDWPSPLRQCIADPSLSDASMQTLGSKLLAVYAEDEEVVEEAAAESVA